MRNPTTTTSRTIQLPLYQGLPYYTKASNIPKPAHGVPCACGAPAGDAYLCPTCTDALEVHLADVPALIEDLNIAAQKRDRVTTSPRHTTTTRESARILDAWDGFRPGSIDPETPVTASLVAADAATRWTAILGRSRPDRPAAAHAIANLETVLVNACKTLIAYGVDTHGLTHTPEGLASWLHHHARTISRHPSAHDIADTIRTAHNRALRIIDNAPATTNHGPCPTMMDDNKPCGTPRRIENTATTWTCPGCATTTSASDLATTINQQARATPLTVRELALATGKTRHAINALIRRRKIQPDYTATEHGRTVSAYTAGPIFDALESRTDTTL